MSTRYKMSANERCLSRAQTEPSCQSHTGVYAAVCCEDGKNIIEKQDIIGDSQACPPGKLITENPILVDTAPSPVIPTIHTPAPKRKTTASFSKLRALLYKKESSGNQEVPSHIRKLHDHPSLRRFRGETATPLPPGQVPVHLWPLLKAMGVPLPSEKPPNSTNDAKDLSDIRDAIKRISITQTS